MSSKTSTLIKFPVLSLRKIEGPSEGISAKTYIAVVNIKDVPDALDDWRDLNVRDPKITGGVAQKIESTLQDNPESFFYRNRGMTVIADKVTFDTKTCIVEMEMTDKDQNGLLDGGHTYSVIRNFIGSLPPEKAAEYNAFVKVEILEGVHDHQAVVDIVESRNTSQQVKEQSIQELLKSYETIKEVLADKPYAENIAYKEYELLEDGSKKTLDIKEILSYLYCFDTESFDDKIHPLTAYSRKSGVISHFRDKRDRMEKYIPLLPQILELRDLIYYELPDAYNSQGGKFGMLTGIIKVDEGSRREKIKLPFTGYQSSFHIPSGFIYPILAAFRNLITVKDGKCSWKVDPIKFFQQLKVDLAVKVGDQAKEFRNPNKLGKDVATWNLCYYVVQLEALKRKL